MLIEPSVIASPFLLFVHRNEYYFFEISCPGCHGTGKIPGTGNLVADLGKAVKLESSYKSGQEMNCTKCDGNYTIPV